MTHRPMLFACALALLGGAACEEAQRTVKPPRAGPAASSASVAGRCEHGLAPKICTKCNPALAAVFQAKGDWCAEHGFPESFCPICSPGAAAPDVGAAAGATTDWCAGHGLPESKCTKCSPSSIPKFQNAGDWCGTHGFPESACPVCNPQRPPPGVERVAIESKRVRFQSPALEKSAGIQTAPAKQTETSPTIECTVRIVFHGDRVADIRAIVPGIVRRIPVGLGARVDRGAPLFELESTRIGEIQGALQIARERVRTAQSNLVRQQGLAASGIASARQAEVAQQELSSAQSSVRTAEATLRMAGADRSAPSGRYTLTAPIAGTVVRRPAVVGLLATEAESLATIADTSVMWALCDVPETDASKLALGQTALVTLEGGEHDPIAGAITWIAAEVDPRARTVTARAELENPRGHLRANQFARARIQTAAPRSGVTVPRAAVQRVGEREVVFVRTAQGVYEPRVIRRSGDEDPVSIEGRVRVGDPVVTTGAVLLRTEIMPGSIGAGCCEVGPPGGN